jgi:transposase-like protein
LRSAHSGGIGKEQTERRKYWQGVIGEQEVSGKSVRDFCRERELGEHSFYWWRHRLREEKPVSFALVETSPAAPAAKFELALSSGEVLHIPADVESLRVVFEGQQ